MTFRSADSGSADIMSLIGANLRKVRKSQGLTLQQVERKSHGAWKAVVVGSYERNDRSLSLKKAIELAEFYHIPIDQLLGIAQPAPTSDTGPRTILDLRRLQAYTKHFDDLTMVSHFAALICAKRKDWNGEVLSLRQSDQTTLALLAFTSEAEILKKLNSAHVLFSLAD
jgi:transcriptional regulator with XRE-family HTH domain